LAGCCARARIATNSILPVQMGKIRIYLSSEWRILQACRQAVKV
jgi:hypothetical protein